MNALLSQDGGSLKYSRLIGTGGIGTGMFFLLEGSHTLGRNESRLGEIVPFKDYCKLHIIAHYVAVLLGADRDENRNSRFTVLPIGKVGDDEPGRQMIDQMRQAGMQTGHVQTVQDASTLFSVCFQYPDSTGGNITTSRSASSLVAPEDIEAFFGGGGSVDASTIVLAAPEVPVDARVKLLREGKARGAFTAASVLSSEVELFSELNGWAYTDLLAVNIDEARTIAGISSEETPSRQIAEACVARCAETNPNMLVSITDGPNGSYGCADGRIAFIPPLKTKAVGTGGAGDAFLSGILVGLTCGLPFIKQTNDSTFSESPLACAMELGTLLASLTVTSPDTIHQTADAALLKRYAEEHQAEMSKPFANLFKEIHS